MEPRSSLPHSQQPATCPYPEPHQSSTCPTIPLPEDPSWNYPPIYALVFQVVSFHLVSPPKPCIRLSCPTYALHAPPISFFLDLITQAILDGQWRSLSISLRSFLHSPCTSSLLGPNILLKILCYWSTQTSQISLKIDFWSMLVNRILLTKHRY